jgi:hypothetical protein
MERAHTHTHTHTPLPEMNGNGKGDQGFGDTIWAEREVGIGLKFPHWQGLPVPPATAWPGSPGPG